MNARLPNCCRRHSHEPASELHKLLGNSSTTGKRDNTKYPKWLCASLFPCIPARLVLTVMLFFGGLVFYTIRVNISVAIVAMVNATADVVTKGNSSLSCHPTAPTFEWTNEQQGLILSGFFYGYVVLQIAGGYLAMRFSSKYVILCGIALPALLSLILPIITRLTSSYVPVLVIRILQGIIGSVVYPAGHAIIGSWAAPNERSRISTLFDAGEIVGSIVTFPMAGWLCKCGFAGGWPSVFYMSGIVSLVWCVFWLFLVYDSPSTHPRISQKELIYIQTSLQNQNKGKRGKTPWLRILTSWAVWANIISHVSNDFGLYVLLTSLPTYLKDTQGVDIKANGLLSAAPFAVNAVLSITVSILTDFAITKGASVVVMRKLNTVIGMVGASAFILMSGFLGDSTIKSVAFVSCSFGINGLVLAGQGPNVLDIAPAYAGVVMGIVNTVSSTAGIVAPLVVKAIAVAPLSEVSVLREQWREVFILAAEIYVFGAIVFAVLASGQVQPWARVNNNNNNNNSNSSSSSNIVVVDNNNDDLKTSQPSNCGHNTPVHHGCTGLSSGAGPLSVNTTSGSDFTEALIGTI